MTISIAVLYALISAVFAAFVAIFAKIGLEHVDTNTATAVRAVIMALFLVGLIIFQGKIGDIAPILADHKAFLFIVFSGVAGALSWLFYFLAIKHGTVAQVVPLDRLSVVFALLLAFFILGEHISLKAGIGAALMVAGGILIAL